MSASILDLFYLCMSTLDMLYMYTATQNCDTYNQGVDLKQRYRQGRPLTMKETSTMKFFKQW